MAQKLKVGEKLVDFNLKGVDDVFYSADSFKDKKLLLVVFSCNHCPYVVACEDRMINLQAKYADKGLQIIAINSNNAVKYPDDSFENMKVRAKEKGFNFLYLHDSSQAVAKAFGATHTPEFFLFDEKRNLIYTGKMDDNWQDEGRVRSTYLVDAIDEYLEGNEISIPETYPIGCTIKWK